MKGLTQFLVKSILGEAAKIDKVVVVYSGRFQPFHKGHYATYSHLVQKFGKDSVYVATSNVTDTKKSPFNFKEKKVIMTKMFGIPSNKIVNIKNPYAPEELLNKFDSDTTGFITVVGEKDQNRLGGNYFKPFKGKIEKGYLDRGYVYAAPAQPNPISGTDVRYWLSAGNVADRKKGFMKAYPKFDEQIFKLITLKLKSLKEYINEEIKLNIKVGDTILMGRFKNKKVTVKSIGKDEHGMPTINGKKAVTFRIPKKDKLTEVSQNFLAGFERMEGDDGTGPFASKWNQYDKQSKVRAEKIGYTPIQSKEDKLREKELTDYKDMDPRTKVTNFPIMQEPKNKDMIGKFTAKRAYTSWLGDAIKSLEDLGWEEAFTTKEKEQRKQAEMDGKQNIKVVKEGLISEDEINQIVDEIMNEMGLPGGAGVGLSLPGGYINGAPNPKDVKKLKSKLDKDDSKEYTKVDEKITTKNHVPVDDGGADDDFNNHHRGGMYTPDWGYEAELDTIDFDDDREKEPGHQADTKDIQNKGYEPIKEENKKNIHTINLKLNNISLKRFQNTPTFKNLLHRDQIKSLKIGDNKLNVNNRVWSVLQRLEGPGNFNVQKIKEDKISGGLAKDMTLKDIAKHHNIDVQTIKQEFIKGYAVEREHTNDINVAKEIALDHLYEDPNYYSKLQKIETPPVKKVGDNKVIKEFTGSNGYSDGIAITGKQWNGSWEEFDGEDYYLEGLEGWEMFDKIPSERIKKSTKDQGLPIDNHIDTKTTKYSRIAKTDLKAPNDFLNEGLLLEGGAYGHMAHPFDIEMGLTFGDLKNIVTKALNGDLELAREKTDGQALAISWVNGRLVAARNKSHLKNKGEGAMTIGQVAEKFAGRGGLTDAYNFAMKDLSRAISQLSEPQRKMIFKGGSCFMNLEVIYPTSVNVIPYGQPLLVFHGTFEYDKEGNVIGENQQAARILAGMIKQVNAHVQSKYTIQGPPMQKLPKSEKLSKLQGKYISMISKLQSEFGLSDNDGVAEYHQAWWTKFVEKNAKKLDTQEKIGLVKRWAFGDKSFRINTIQDPKIKAWAEQTDKQDQQKISKQNLMKFEEIFLGVGADVLSFMSSVLTANPESAKRQMVARLESTIQQVKASGDPKKIQKLKLELQRLNALGGFEKIVPNEGIVFTYGGNTYKLTGAFAPLNQILGIFFEK